MAVSMSTSPAASMSAGRIELVMGPMFSGKTTELFRRMRRLRVAQNRCLLVKYEKDTRYSDSCVATHDQQTVVAEPVSRLQDLDRSWENFEVIAIDEGQFYPDLVEYCNKFAGAGKTVIISALDGTFERKPFGDVLSLIPLADAVTKLTAVCALCYAEAPFTQRLSTETKVEIIGGSEMYRPVCRSCWMHSTTEMARVQGRRVSNAVLSEPSSTASRSPIKKDSAPGRRGAVAFDIRGA